MVFEKIAGLQILFHKYEISKYFASKYYASSFVASSSLLVPNALNVSFSVHFIT